MYDKNSKIGFIGLGTMGYPMAGHLAQQGYQVTVYNRTIAKAEKWQAQYQGKIAITPAEVARNADIVFSCVGNDNDLRAVTIGEQGAFQALAPHAVFIDHSTTSAEVARELANLAQQQNCYFLDAPVSGGQVGAEKGILTIMVGGDADVFAQVQPVITAYAKAVTLMGTSGMGQLTKMVNQICIGGLLQGLSEAIHFGEQAGLDVKLVLDVISKGAAQSWQMENRGKTMVDRSFNFGFAVDWMRKDLGLCLAEARRNGATLPITALVDQFYADVQEKGGQRWDTSSLITRLGKKQ
ncbi:beta-hydroxyacid dehydrogenase, 3-hydroxyisobutyrate dehydrogenase [Beggiatoa alba B18LD]|uniref:Beta-hydroxyacid dehydrogenase, 3-hydroxyisobutyrate dehydrogenase n=1 Tax=Beggiatoa alba B18LD TaxID=395493 RepID=I3CDI6_9GAMM|nr:NAD(P)-dependent oxidoreductase [Beggiatoa alba]EIJ41679.1 beta-hydroxyacid dehydrogenase, 3-hydroxyisobutyrate dehydrogenase [Beggiatoa alba B18LD]